MIYLPFHLDVYFLQYDLLPNPRTFCNRMKLRQCRAYAVGSVEIKMDHIFSEGDRIVHISCRYCQFCWTPEIFEITILLGGPDGR